MIKVIAFDVGGVLVDTGDFPRNIATGLAEVLNYPSKKLLAAYEKLLPQLESGKNLLAALAQEKSASALESLYRKTAENNFVLNQELFKFALKLKKTQSVGIISNIDQYLAKMPLHQKIYSSFDSHLVVLSYQVKTRKPDKKIYEIFLQKARVKPENCLFVDDKPENVAAAQGLGFQAIVFKNNPQFKKCFQKYLQV